MSIYRNVMYVFIFIAILLVRLALKKFIINCKSRTASSIKQNKADELAKIAKAEINLNDRRISMK
jgi:hypothetical protein